MSMNERQERTLIDYVGLAARGFAMGTSDIVPGVSGGTMALILGIYEELITSIKDVLNREAIRLALRFKIKDALDLIPWNFLRILDSVRLDSDYDGPVVLGDNFPLDFRSVSQNDDVS